MAKDITGKDFDPRTPAVLTPSSAEAGIGGSLRKVTAYGQRLGEAAGKLGKLLQSEANSPSGAKSCVMRVTPTGGGNDTVESMDWAPKDWRAKGWTPEGLRTFGSPWMVAGMPGSARIGPINWPVPGMGQFLIQVKSSSAVVTFP